MRHAEFNLLIAFCLVRRYLFHVVLKHLPLMCKCLVGLIMKSLQTMCGEQLVDDPRGVCR